MTAALLCDQDWSNEQSAKFLGKVWQSVLIINLKLPAQFCSPSADGLNTGTFFTAWQRIEGLCHDCLGFPSSFIPEMMRGVTESLSGWSAFSWIWCLPGTICNSSAKSRTCCVTRIWYFPLRMVQPSLSKFNRCIYQGNTTAQNHVQYSDVNLHIHAVTQADVID